MRKHFSPRTDREGQGDYKEAKRGEKQPYRTDAAKNINIRAEHGRGERKSYPGIKEGQSCCYTTHAGNCYSHLSVALSLLWQDDLLTT